MLTLRFMLAPVSAALLLLVAATAHATDDGCTPGYWKNNFTKHDGSAWDATGVTGPDPLSSVGFSGYSVRDGDSTTFIDALKARGGCQSALMRHGTAAYLNAAHPDISYGRKPERIVILVNAALETGDCIIIDGLKDRLEDRNDRICPLNQRGESER